MKIKQTFGAVILAGLIGGCATKIPFRPLRDQAGIEYLVRTMNWEEAEKHNFPRVNFELGGDYCNQKAAAYKSERSCRYVGKDISFPYKECN